MVIVDDGPRPALTFVAFFNWFLRILFGIIVFLIGLRFLLLLLGANRANALVSWVLTNSYPLVSPFFGIFPTPAAGRFVLETASLIALFVYGFIFYLVGELMDYLAYLADRRGL